MIERATTHIYPTRYAACEAPGCLVVLRPDLDGLIHPVGHRPQPGDAWLRAGGREIAVFTEAQVNRDWPGCSDGVYVEVRSLTDNPRSRVPSPSGFLVDSVTSAPTLSRRQRVKVRRSVVELEEALQAAEELAEAGRAWVAHHLENERVLEVDGRRLALLEEEGTTVVMRPISASRVAIAKDGSLEVVDYLGLGQDGEERRRVLAELCRVLSVTAED